MTLLLINKYLFYDFLLLSQMAFFTSPPALSYFKQLKAHRGFILIENSRDGSIHTMNIGDMDICEARALMNEQYDQYRIDMGESFADTFSARRQSVTSDREISDKSRSDQGDVLGGEALALPVGNQEHRVPAGVEEDRVPAGGQEDRVPAGDQEDRVPAGRGHETRELPDRIDPATDGLDDTDQDEIGAAVHDDQTTPITLHKVFTFILNLSRSLKLNQFSFST